jgi:hypothetical protein
MEHENLPLLAVFSEKALLGPFHGFELDGAKKQDYTVKPTSKTTWQDGQMKSHFVASSSFLNME